MIADRFVASLGVLQVDLEKAPELRALILEKVKIFFRMHGTISWDELAEMDEATVAIFLQAADEVEAERADRAAQRVVDKVAAEVAAAMKEPQP